MNELVIVTCSPLEMTRPILVMLSTQKSESQIDEVDIPTSLSAAAVFISKYTATVKSKVLIMTDSNSV